MKMRVSVGLVLVAGSLRGQVVQPVAGTVPVCAATSPAGSHKGHPTDAEIAAVRDGVAADPSFVLADERLKNFAVSRYELVDYANCVGTHGCYWKDLDAQFVRAEKMLKAKVAEVRAAFAKSASAGVVSTNGPLAKRMALVLDIDETSLTAYCEEPREDWGYLGKQFNEWVVTEEGGMGIPGSRRLFELAKSEGVAVFFITGRPEAQRDATAKNLKAAGFVGYEGLRLKPVGYTGTTIAYKSGERRKIESLGYRIVMNVGDQFSDLLGEPKAEISVKVPNPFYYLP